MGGNHNGGSPSGPWWTMLTALAVVAGCSTPHVVAVAPTTAPPTTSTTQPARTSAPTTATAPSQQSSALTTTSAAGTTVAKPIPKAVVSLSPTATETLFALGAGGLVKAVDTLSSYPPSAPRTDLTGATPDIDKLMAFGPDLVVLSEDPAGSAAALAARGVAVILQPPATSLDDSYAQIRQLGAAIGRTAEAEQLVGGMQAKIAAIVSKTPPTPLRYYHERTDQFASVTSASFLGQLYGLLNLRSIADASVATGAREATLSAQVIIDANPDLIVLADTKCCRQTSDTLRARPGWSALTAISTNTVVIVDDDLATRWGPRIVDLLQAIAGRLLARTAS
jgi:iron complex transport system substrate-binding protein